MAGSTSSSERHPDDPEEGRVDRRDDQTEDRGDHQVRAGAVGEAAHRADDRLPLGACPGEPPGEVGRIESHEQHDQQQEEEVRERARQPDEQVCEEPRDVAERDLAQRGLELVAADAERGEPGLQVAQEGGEAVLVGRQDLSVGRTARTPAGRRRQSLPQGWLASCQMISTSSAMTRIDQKG
jgi:hypothetical protein